MNEARLAMRVGVLGMENPPRSLLGDSDPEAAPEDEAPAAEEAGPQ